MPARKNRPAAPERVGPMQTRKERRETVELFGRAFANPTWMERYVDKALYKGPIFHAEHTRVTIVEGRVAAGVVMGPRMVRFGPVKVPAMTVGPVGTHDAFRKQGRASAAMNDASAYMAENGFLVAYLQGISDFYHRFGYYPFMGATTLTLKRDAAKKQSLPGRFRVMRRKDMPAVRRLYEAVTASRICASARDKEVWDWLTGPASRTWLFRHPRVIVDAHGRLCGYSTVPMDTQRYQGELLVRQDETSCRVALGALVGAARRGEMKELILPLPWDDALSVFIRQFVGGDSKMSANANGGPMLKVVDFPALMRKLQPLFSRRWQRANTALLGARFTLESEIGSIGIAAGPEGVRMAAPENGRRVVIPQRWLSGLLTGYHAVRHVAARQGAAVPSELMPVMEILFPTGWPFVYQGDNY
jgi:predicted N-acetyltransferase YhbS